MLRFEHFCSSSAIIHLKRQNVDYFIFRCNLYILRYRWNNLKVEYSNVCLFVCLFVSTVYFVNGGSPSQLLAGSTRVSTSKTRRIFLRTYDDHFLLFGQTFSNQWSRTLLLTLNFRKPCVEIVLLGS